MQTREQVSTKKYQKNRTWLKMGKKTNNEGGRWFGLKENVQKDTRISSNKEVIIMSCRQHGYPWPSLTTSPYRSSPLAGLQGCIPYPHRAAVCMFELVVLLLLGHESSGVVKVTIINLGLWGKAGYLSLNPFYTNEFIKTFVCEILNLKQCRQVNGGGCLFPAF